MIMDKFSVRIGAEEPKKLLLLNEMTKELKRGLWNVIHSIYREDIDASWINHDPLNRETISKWYLLAKLIAANFKITPVDEINDDSDWCMSWIKIPFMESIHWYYCYNLVEFIVDCHGSLASANSEIRKHDVNDVVKRFNYVLERELSAYRFISGKLVPITNEVEIKGIEDAIEQTKLCGLSGASIHLSKAIDFFSKKPTPDYANVIKEAISAVDSAFMQINGIKSNKFSEAIAILSPKINLHGAFVSALNSLYGYTSDEGGIRHSIFNDDVTIDLDDAKYMIITCSAFVNYIIPKANSAGLLNRDS